MVGLVGAGEAAGRGRHPFPSGAPRRGKGAIGMLGLAGARILDGCDLCQRLSKTF